MPEPYEFVDMRFKSPRPIVDVLDAIAIARRCDRSEVVNEVLLKYTRQVAHEAMVIAKVTQGNPRVMDSQWQGAE